MPMLVGFLGGPCTGKTTLAQSVSCELADKGINTEWATEFVSEDIQRIGPPVGDYFIYEQFHFAFYQTRKEEEAMKRAEIVVTDAPLLLGYSYPLLEKDIAVCGRQQTFIQDLEGLFVEDAKRYDKLYLLRRESEYEDNNIRFHTYEQAVEFDKLLRNKLDSLGVEYIELGGSVMERTWQVMEDLGYGYLLKQAV